MDIVAVNSLLRGIAGLSHVLIRHKRVIAWCHVLLYNAQPPLHSYVIADMSSTATGCVLFSCIYYPPFHTPQCMLNSTLWPEDLQQSHTSSSLAMCVTEHFACPLKVTMPTFIILCTCDTCLHVWGTSRIHGLLTTNSFLNQSYSHYNSYSLST